MATSAILRAVRPKYLAYPLSSLASRFSTSFCASTFGHKWANLARPFSSKPARDKVIGIDLGTNNSCVAVMDGKSLKVIENFEGSRTTPSVVAFNQNGEVIVGTEAKRQLLSNPMNTIFGTKRLIGRRFDDPWTREQMKTFPYKIVKAPNGDAWIEANGQQYSPSKIASFILIKMKETAENYLGESISNAVITVPPNFSGAQRLATKEAAQIAGLEVQRFINEPTAAALFCGMNKKSVIAVFHFGGGTFDVSIVNVATGLYNVVAAKSDTFGGEDFDNALLDFLVNEFKRAEGIDLTKDSLVVQRLRAAAENAKIELSSKSQTEIKLPFITAGSSGAKHLNITLTRTKFEALVNHLIEKTKNLCKSCLKDAGISIESVDEVLLVGGMTRVPKVQEVVSEIFCKKHSKVVNSDEAVVMGAAIEGGIRHGDVRGLHISDGQSCLFTQTIDWNVIFPTGKSQDFASEEVLWRLYEDWRAYHEVVTGLNEKNRRFKAFKEKVQKVYEHNQKRESHRIGLTRFADLTSEEFIKKYEIQGLELEYEIQGLKYKMQDLTSKKNP